jgi:glutathione S-transferase
MRKTWTDRLNGRLDWVETQLAAHPYFMSSGFTVADAYLYTVLRWSDRTQVDLSKRPAIQAFMGRMAARPAVVEALKIEAAAA